MIYYVEDDANIRDLVIYTLTQTGFSAKGCAGGQEFYAACAAQTPELILLDIMLPDEDGLAILKRVKADRALAGVPVIMVTAKGTEYDKVVGLDSGADDYLTKPFGMMELVARVKARLRASAAPQSLEILKCGDLELNSTSHSVTVGGQAVTLTLKEFALLRLFMEHRGVAFTREQLLERNWDYGYEGGTRTVDVHVQTLRTKLGGCGAMIQTVRGVGYKFEG